MSKVRPLRPLAICIESKIAFKIYLNITPTATSWAADDKSFSLIFDENPLADFVELPEDGPYEKLWYSNVLCGVIRGALEMVEHISCQQNCG
jgi:trafficking protein particle complex subunit 3